MTFNRRAHLGKEKEAISQQRTRKLSSVTTRDELLVKVLNTYMPGEDSGFELDKDSQNINCVRVQVEPIDNTGEGYRTELENRTFPVQAHPSVLQQDYTTNTSGGGHLNGHIVTLSFTFPQVSTTGKIHLKGHRSWGNVEGEQDFSTMYTVSRFQLPIL